MKKLKVMTIFGTRPEAIKFAPVIKLLYESKKITPIVTITAQHREMLDQVLELFAITPDHDLNIMRSGQDLFDVTTRALTGVKEVLLSDRPDLVLVQGDTTTTFAAALAAFYLKIPVGHIEAGLRSFERYHPFPEEINRVLTSDLAEFHFAPTTKAKDNLMGEGIASGKIIVSGNTVIDALLSVINPKYKFDLHPILGRVDFDDKKVILVTSHRRENWGEPFEEICKALKKLAAKNEDIAIIFSVHLNPVLSDTAQRLLSGEERIYIIDPLDYEPFIQLISKSHIVLTDSGGIQEEAPSLGKPVLVLRDFTERPEGVEAGTVKLVGAKEKNIIFETEKLLRETQEYDRMAKAINPYGDGLAAKRIVTFLEERMVTRK